MIARLCNTVVCEENAFILLTKKLHLCNSEVVLMHTSWSKMNLRKFIAQSYFTLLSVDTGKPLLGHIWPDHVIYGWLSVFIWMCSLTMDVDGLKGVYITLGEPFIICNNITINVPCHLKSIFTGKMKWTMCRLPLIFMYNYVLFLCLPKHYRIPRRTNELLEVFGLDFFLAGSVAKHFQILRVSSAAAETTVCPSGLMAIWRTRQEWPVSSVTLTIDGYFHTVSWFCA